MREIATLFLTLFLSIFGGAEREDDPKTPTGAERKIYQESNFSNPDGQWSLARSRQSARFAIFWENGFGDDPNGSDLDEKRRVDVDDLLEKAERFFDTNVEKLGFGAENGNARACDKYKLEIYLCDSDEWIASGAGRDDAVGALWISPAACRPAGAVVAHEIGHIFQYLVYCDQLLDGAPNNHSSGWRYACRNGLGNTIWEQCAEWQAQQDYPKEAFAPHNLDIWNRNRHRAFENEWMRYQSYWLLYAVADLRGRDAIGRLWRESKRPEDFIGAYLRIFCDGDVNRLDKDLYYYASRAATYDFNDVRDIVPKEWLEPAPPDLLPCDEKKETLQIAYASCPDEAGFNAIPINLDDFGDAVAVEFESLELGAPLAKGDPGEVMSGENGDIVSRRVERFNKPAEMREIDRARHCCGFVALMRDGRREYGTMRNDSSFVERFKIPSNAARVYFVVMGATTARASHKWNNDESDDLQLPYRVHFFRP